jgi:hypothetical protein
MNVILTIIWLLQKLETLSISELAAQTSDVKIFNLKKLNMWQSKNSYQVKISNRLAVFKNLDINNAWERIRI